LNSTNQKDSIEDVRIENGLIVFSNYQLYKQKAEEARDFLKALDVSPESEQECKRTVAAARKISDQLNQEKIRIKKSVLEPYNSFEAQVKEIISIITDGENVARDKLKAIDDQRREEKREAIRQLWEARAGSYESCMYIDFDRFLADKHLNKTVTISEIEKEMIRFMYTTTEDIQLLQKLPLKDEYIAEYIDCLNVTEAMNKVNQRHEVIKAQATEPYMLIKITGKADVILAKQLLKDINYKVLEEK